jgi:hypothetical protein
VASTACRANTKLAYIQIELAKFQAGHAHYKVNALHDGGSEVTLIKTSIFRKIPDYTDIRIISQPNTYVSSVTGSMTPVYGSAILFLKFTGENGKTITYPHEVYIHDEIDHDFILGRDFTGSAAKLLETPQHIYLTAENESSDFEDFWERAKHTCCDVPLLPHDQVQRTFKVYATQTTVIQPYDRAVITARYENNSFIPIPVHYGQPVPFEVINLLQPHLETPHALYHYTNPQKVSFTVYNNSSEDYLVHSDEPIAQISVFEELPTVQTLAVTASSYKEFKSYRAALHTAEFIEEDEGLTEDEKLQGFHQYVTSGHYPISMTKVVEDAPSLTHLNLVDDRPITDEQLLSQFNISHLSPKHQQQAKEIFLKHKGAFSRHDYDLGCAKDIEMDIELIKSNSKKPQLQSYRPLPHATRGPMKEILDQMEKYGIIRECDEPSLFVSNILVIEKKDKNQLRLLLDGRLLNENTVKYPTSLVTQPEVFAHLHNRKWVSNADVSHSFFQVPISSKSQPYTAFFSQAHGKRYCFQRCPQGLKNSPLYLKLLMDKLLGCMAHYVLHYADDILIATDRDLTHHIEVVGEVLRKLEEGGIKIRPKKLHLATDSIEFLGVKWQLGKLHIPKARVLAFKNYPKPTTAKQTKSFVCAMSYYRRFLPHFAELARPLLELSSAHHKQFKWKQEHDTAFYKLIELLITHTSLNIPDPNRPYYVQTDASDYCGAGRVFQKDDEGNERLLACVSRTFTRTERKYGVFRKETLALLYTLKSMDFFLRFANKVILLVDAKSIIFLRMCRDSAGILLRFSLELSKYEAEIYHVPGKENEISDILSRNHINLKDIIDEEKRRHILSEEQTEQILRRLTIPHGRHFTADEVKWLLEADSIENPIPPKKKKPPSKAKLGTREIKNIPPTLPNRKVKLPKISPFRTQGVILPANAGRLIQPQSSTVTYTDFAHATRMITSGEVSIKNLIVAQRDDPQIGRIIKLKKLPPRFTYIDNVLYHKLDTHYRLALPTAFLDPLIHSKHFSVMGLHFSKTRILRDIQTKFFVNIKVLKQKLQLLKENCILCQFNASAPKQHPLQQSNLIFAPRVTWACDIIPSLPTSKRGHNAMFLVVDMFTGYIQLAPLKSRSAEDLIEAVLATIIRPFTIPKYFRCDSETAMFSSYEFHAFMEPLGISFLPCSTGAPWSNGAAERAVQTIKQGLRKFVLQEDSIKNWDDYIHFFSASHNKSTSVYGYAPEQLHFGFTNPVHTDLFQIWPNVHDQQEYMDKIVPPAMEARKQARSRQEKTLKSKITYRNIGLKKKVFKPGQVVLQRNLQLATGPGKAMQPKYNGPYVIISIDKDESSALIEHMHTNQQVRAHFSNISLLNYLPQYHRTPGRYDTELLKFIPEKFSYEKYYGKERKRQKRDVTPTVTDRLSQTQGDSLNFNLSLDSDSNPNQSNSGSQHDDQEYNSVELDLDFENSQNSVDNTDDKIPLFMPSILKKKPPQVTHQTDQILVPSIIKTTNDSYMANKPHKIILPQIVKTDKTRTSKTKVATPLLDPSIIRNNVEEHEIPKVNARRSERIKKPPDKLQY